MGMQPRANHQQLIWGNLTPKQRRQRILKNALMQAEQTGDYSAYNKLMWDSMSPKRKKEQMISNAIKSNTWSP